MRRSRTSSSAARRGCRQVWSLVFIDMVQAERQGHFTFFVVVAVGFAVGGDLGDLGLVRRMIQRVHEFVGEQAAVVEQPFESDGFGDAAVVEKQVDATTAGQRAAIGTAAVYPSVHLVPVFAVLKFNGFTLARGQHGKADAVVYQSFQGIGIDGGFGEPHSFGHPVEAGLKIGDAPPDLGVLVPLIGQRHDDVVITLGQGAAVATEAGHAVAVGLLQPLIGSGVVGFQPTQERRPHVPADAGVVVGNSADAVGRVEYTGFRIRGVALLVDALVPVMIRCGAFLYLDGFQPGVLPRWLVEMAVDADVLFVIFRHAGEGTTGQHFRVRDFGLIFGWFYVWVREAEVRYPKNTKT